MCVCVCVRPEATDVVMWEYLGVGGGKHTLLNWVLKGGVCHKGHLFSAL